MIRQSNLTKYHLVSSPHRLPSSARLAASPHHLPSPPPLATSPRHLASPPLLATFPRHLSSPPFLATFPRQIASPLFFVSSPRHLSSPNCLTTFLCQLASPPFLVNSPRQLAFLVANCAIESTRLVAVSPAPKDLVTPLPSPFVIQCQAGCPSSFSHGLHGCAPRSHQTPSLRFSAVNPLPIRLSSVLQHLTWDHSSHATDRRSSILNRMYFGTSRCKPVRWFSFWGQKFTPV